MNLRKDEYKYIIVAGCSRFGANIATMFSNQEREVVVVDIDGNAFNSLSRSYSGFTLQGDATDIDVLKEAGIEKADIFIAATDDDDTNIMISEIAEEIFGVPRVISRIYDTEKRVVYEGFEIDTIEPFELTLNEFERLISSER